MRIILYKLVYCTVKKTSLYSVFLNKYFYLAIYEAVFLNIVSLNFRITTPVSINQINEYKP